MSRQDPHLNGFVADGKVAEVAGRVAVIERGGGGGGGGGGSVVDATTVVKGKIQLAGHLSGTAAAPIIDPAAQPEVANFGIGTPATTAKVKIGTGTLTLDDTDDGDDQDYWGHYFDGLGFGSVAGKRYRIYDGTNAAGVTEFEPTFKISRVTNVTGLAAAVTAPPLSTAIAAGDAAVDFQRFVALNVSHTAQSGSEVMVTGIAGTAYNGNSGKPNQDAVGVIGAGITAGTGVGTGSYFEGKRYYSAAAALATEARVNNYSNSTGSPGVNNSNGLYPAATGGLWITSAGRSGNTNSFATSIGFASSGQAPFIWGYHVGSGSLFGSVSPILDTGTVASAFRDDSNSATSLMINGTHANAAVSITSTAGTPASGFLLGADTNLYRSAANVLRTDDGFGVGLTGAAGIGGVGVYMNPAGVLNVERASGSNVIAVWNGTTENVARWTLVSTGEMIWRDQTDTTATGQDVGLKRPSAGILRVTDATTSGYGDFQSKSVTLAGDPTPPAALAVARFTDTGNGDDASAYGATPVPAQRYNIWHGKLTGTTPGPVTTDGATVKIARTSAHATVGNAGDFAKYSTLYAVHVGTAACEAQVVGVVGAARTSSTATPTGSPGSGSNDACGMFGVGYVIDASGSAGTGAPMGAFFQAQTNSTAAKGMAGVQIQVNNITGVSTGTVQTDYATSGLRGCGVFIAANTEQLAAGVLLSNVLSQKFEVGYAVQSSVIKATTTTAAAFRDDSDSATSLLVNGTHAEGAVRITSTAGGPMSGLVFGASGADDVRVFRATASSLVLDCTTTAATTSGVGIEIPTSLTAAQTVLSLGGRVGTPQTITLGASAGIRGASMFGAWTATAASATSSLIGFQVAPTITFSAVTAQLIKSVRGFNSAPIYTMASGSTAHGNVSASGQSVAMFRSAPTLTAQGSTETAGINTLTHFVAGTGDGTTGHTVGAGWTVTTWRGLHLQVPAGTGSIQTLAGVDIEDMSTLGGTAPAAAGFISLRSKSTTLQMQHAGPAKIGSTGTVLTPALLDTPTLELERTLAFSAPPGGDAYCASLALDPAYTAAGTIARHNYIDVQDVALTTTVLTDACLVRFDAAAGTHKAVDGNTTKTSPGTVSAWVKININGTVHYMPAYTSKTT